MHWHALVRMRERGATEHEILATIAHGERVGARRGRIGFRHTFRGAIDWHGRSFTAKELIVYAVPEIDGWLAITVIVKYLRRKERLQ
jgi:hypothetical protein